MRYFAVSWPPPFIEPDGRLSGAQHRASGAGWRVVGVWLVGVGFNYIVLALHAVSLSRTGALDDELDGVDVAS